VTPVERFCNHITKLQFTPAMQLVREEVGVRCFD